MRCQGPHHRCWMGLHVTHWSESLGQRYPGRTLGSRLVFFILIWLYEKGLWRTYLCLSLWLTDPSIGLISSPTEWRRPIGSIADPSSSLSPDPVYARIVSWFVDSSSPLAPFSVHRFASKGKELGKEVGEWFGPSTAAGAIKSVHFCFPRIFSIIVVSAI